LVYTHSRKDKYGRISNVNIKVRVIVLIITEKISILTYIDIYLCGNTKDNF